LRKRLVGSITAFLANPSQVPWAWTDSSNHQPPQELSNPFNLFRF